MTTKIGITGTGSLIGQAIIKCIKSSKYASVSQLIGFDYFSGTIGSYWCSQNFTLPDIYINPSLEKEWLTTIIDLCIKNKLEYLFVGVDFELPLFSKYKSHIEEVTNVKIFVSDESVINVGNDKYKTYKFLEDNNLNYPLTSSYADFSESVFDYPVILKPAVGARSRGVYKINNTEELDKFALKIKLPIVQELIGDDESEFTCGVLMLEGQFISSIALRRTLKEGNTSKAFYKTNFPDIIYSYIKDICLALKPYGSCNLQLRIDKNGVPKLFEINPRHSGTTFIRSQFGYNEIEMILDYFIEGKVKTPKLREGVVIRYYDEMFYSK